MNSLLDLIFLGDSGPKKAPTSLLDFDPATSRKAGFAQGLMPLGMSLIAAGQGVDPATRAKLLMGGVEAAGNTARGHVQGEMQGAMVNSQLADAKRKAKQDEAWQALMNGGPMPGMPLQPPGTDTRTASVPDASSPALGAPPGASIAAMPPAPGSPSPNARVDMNAASPFSAIPPNMRPIVAAMGPEKGSAFIGSVMAKNLDRGNWVREDREIDGKMVPGQVDKNPTSPTYGKWQGYDPATTKIALNPNVNLPPQESEFEKGVGRSFAEMYSGMQNTVLSAPGKMAKLDKLDAMLSKAYTGLGGEQVQQANRALKAAGDALGLDTSGITDKVGGAEAAQALANEIALEFRNPSGGAGMPGAMSDQDREFLKQMTGANLSTTPEGRKKIIDTRRKLAERELQVAKLARDYRKKHGKFDDGFFDDLAEFSAKNPLFPAPKEAAPGPAVPGSDPLGLRGGQ